MADLPSAERERHQIQSIAGEPEKNLKTHIFFARMSRCDSLCEFTWCLSFAGLTDSETLASHASNAFMVSGAHTILIMMRRTQIASRHSNQCNSAKATREVIAAGATITIINEPSCRAHSLPAAATEHISFQPKKRSDAIPYSRAIRLRAGYLLNDCEGQSDSKQSQRRVNNWWGGRQVRSS